MIKNIILSCVNENYVHAIKITSDVCVPNIYFCILKTVYIITQIFKVVQYWNY